MNRIVPCLAVLAVLAGLLLPATLQAQSCNPTATTACLNQGRFEVEVSWSDFVGGSGVGQLILTSEDSALFWFFNSENWEMLVKVIDGCNANDRFWVFAAATTNVEYTLRVTDTVTGVVKSYTNPLGRQAPATTDTDAFATCDGSVSDGLPPDPGPAGDLTLEGIDVDGDGMRDDVQRYIELTYPHAELTKGALRQIAGVTQAALENADSQADALDNMEQLMRGVECLLSIRPDDALSVSNRLLAEVLDTEQRGLAYFDFEGQLEGAIIPSRDPDNWAASCTQSPQFPEEVSERLKNDETCGTSETEVFFGNGIKTHLIQAELATQFLRLRLRRTLPPELYATLSFSTAYNPTEDFWRDVWEAFQQDVNTSWSQFFLMLSGEEDVSEEFRDLYLRLSAAFDQSAVANSPTLQDHLRAYRDAIFQGRKVLVVSHSQGNYFANQAFANLSAEERESFGIVSVANPNDFVAGGGLYTTLEEDLLINYLIDLAVEPLPPNTSNGIGILLNDWSGHGFIEAYLPLGTPSSNKIEQDIEFVLNSLETPTQVGGDGIVTVTLRWGNQPDVDLHVFEPNGEHVYYANQTGLSGTLDVDDTTGFGPENYVVDCSTLEVGIYSVGVNYYRGNGPETAEVTINAGLQVRNFEIPLSQAVGSSGDNSPIPVAEVEVIGDPQGGFEFEVR